MLKNHNQWEAPGGKHTYDALYSCLLHLKPTNCLEIGTFYGKSAEVFQTYFNRYCPHGKMITCDIKKYTDLSHLSNITQIIVHPHVKNSSQFHHVTNDEILPQTDDFMANANIIKNVFDKKFDFCFLDGDHQYYSACRDLFTANQLLNNPKYILFDDMNDETHESTKVFQELIMPNYNTYTFDDWYINTGCALIWEKQ